jgi:16S rRNA (uracil1498-N3)-methyltransferase
MDRYYSRQPIDADRVVLDGPELHHLTRVMRAQVGERVVLFDGRGAEYVARIDQITRHAAALCIEEQRSGDRELAIEVTLAVALPKGERQRWLVEKLVELGVHRLVPLVTARGVAQPVDAALARLERGVIEASKQCGRNRLMEIAAPLRWQELLSEKRFGIRRLFAHPSTAAEATPAAQGNARHGLPGGDERRVVAAVGPEGGFTEEEVAQALAGGWKPVDLGPRILRVETAALVVSALLGQGILASG